MEQYKVMSTCKICSLFNVAGAEVISIYKRTKKMFLWYALQLDTWRFYCAVHFKPYCEFGSQKFSWQVDVKESVPGKMTKKLVKTKGSLVAP